MRLSWRIALALAAGWPIVAFAQQAAPPAGGPSTGVKAPAQTLLSASAPITGEGRLQLDVVVTDKAGKPVSGLESKDFALLEDNRQGKVVSFHAMDATMEKAETPTEVLLMLDTVNLGVNQVTFFRQEMQRFLRLNNGQLAYPVSVFVITADGMRALPPTLDGNKVAAALDQVGTALRTADLTTGEGAELARFQASVKWLTGLVRSEAPKPGRKLLIWGGPGWSSLDGPDFRISDRMLQGDFSLIVELSTLLRQGHITLYSISAASDDSAKSVNGGAKGGMPSRRSSGFTTADLAYNNESGPFQYKTFLKGVKKADDAKPAYLGLQVLAARSGGLVLGPGNNLAEQIDQCVQDASVTYRITFDPPATNRANEYHDLKVRIDRDGLTARTQFGYYNQP